MPARSAAAAACALGPCPFRPSRSRPSLPARTGRAPRPWVPAPRGCRLTSSSTSRCSLVTVGNRGSMLHQRVGEHRPDADPREPLAVGRDHVPRRPLGARVREHLRERLLVVVPALALADVGGRELPVVVGQVDPAQEPDPLLLLGEVEEQLHDPEAVVGQVALPVVDLAVAPLPDVAASWPRSGASGDRGSPGAPGRRAPPRSASG